MIHLHVASTLGSFRDYQEIKIQEQVQKLDIGQISSNVCKWWVVECVRVCVWRADVTQLFLDSLHIPRSMWVVLENDLVDSCKPGDDVTIT